jgi:hypothetical protein
VPSAKKLSDDQVLVSVRGPLAIGFVSTTLVGCAPPACCNETNAVIVVGASSDEHAFQVPGLSCSGDESTACCNAPAYGQPVIATGRIVYLDDINQPKWALADATLCEDESATPQQQ